MRRKDGKEDKGVEITELSTIDILISGINIDKSLQTLRVKFVAEYCLLSCDIMSSNPQDSHKLYGIMQQLHNPTKTMLNLSLVMFCHQHPK